MLRKYAQDQLGAGHHTATQTLLEVTLLTSGKLVIDEQQVGSMVCQAITELNEFTFAHIRARMRCDTAGCHISIADLFEQGLYKVQRL